MKELTRLMENVFKRHREYPMNSMTPSLSYGDGKVVVSMLILGEEDIIQDFVADTYGRVNIEISCYTEPNKNDVGTDLVIRIDFFYPTGQPMFETVIYGDSPEMQKEFVKALKEVQTIVVWIADKNHEVVKVMKIDWNYNVHSRVLNPLL